MKDQIYPCLWFDGKAHEAAEFYCSVFNGSIIADNSMVTMFELGGRKFMGLNGGPMFTPNASISFFVVCETEEETDQAWAKLMDGGHALMGLDKYPWSEKYGWVMDKYGVSWQLAYGKLADVEQKITPCLMFTQQHAGQAEEAISYYTSVFKNSSVAGILKYAAGEDDVEGHVKHAQFKLNGNVFMAMDSSMEHAFTFDEGISLVVPCDTQEEIDYFWNTLTSDGGQESMCGWLKDKYGVSWQIVPSMLGSLISNTEKGERAMQALMNMRKLVIEELENA